MALTMTRTRTQTALTKLVELLANLNGELDFVNDLVASADCSTALLERQRELLEKQQALKQTLVLFDPTIDPETIGRLDVWRKPYRARTEKTLRAKYVRGLQS